MKFNYSTVGQLRTRFRQEFQSASGVRLHRMAKWADTNLTDNQLQSLFGLTAPQTATLRSRLLTMHSRIDAVDAEVGQ